MSAPITEVAGFTGAPLAPAVICTTHTGTQNDVASALLLAGVALMAVSAGGLVLTLRRGLGDEGGGTTFVIGFFIVLLMAGAILLVGAYVDFSLGNAVGGVLKC